MLGQKTAEELFIEPLAELESRPSRPWPPTKKIAIFSIQRSGSTHFCNLLGSSNEFGEPREWLNQRALDLYLKSRNIKHLHFPDFLRDVLFKTTTPNGVFSINVQMNQYIHWRERGFDLLSIGFDKVFYLQRRDRIAQAFSFTKALATDQWMAHQAPKREVPPAAIENSLILHALYSFSKWEEYYNRHVAHCVDRTYFYEDLVEDAGIVQSVFRECGLECREPEKLSSSVKVQRTDEDDLRIRQFRNYLLGAE
ncbi:Stf0 family sulfotransferase [Parvibaculum sp.]|uniref:Stf0 family sulfotransferase n=1 Tax=Parvibaculum sp. TaxID=2024848 RepID=UPI00320F2B3C